MTTKPTPQKRPKAAPPVDRAVAHPITAGLGVVRKQLFSSPVTAPGWEKHMLTHIAAAKALGFTMFEIDTTEAMVPRPKATAEKDGGFFGSFVIRIEAESEEWKSSDDSDEKGGKLRATVVTVYALAIE